MLNNFNLHWLYSAMPHLNIFAFTYVCFIIFSLNFSVALEEIKSEMLTDIQEIKSEQLTDVLKDTENSLDYINRKEIAEKYINTLVSLEEEWVDPYDMISFTAKELQEMSLKLTDQHTVLVSVTSGLANDDNTFHKNVKTESIHEKALTTDKHAKNKEIESDSFHEVKSVEFTHMPENNEESLNDMEVVQDIKSEKLIDVPNISERSLDYTNRKEISKNYVNSLETAEETWVDPHDTISFSVDEQQRTAVKPTDENTEPIFSSSSAVSHETDLDGISETCSQQISLIDNIYISRWLKKLLLKIEKESNMEPSDVIFSLDSTAIENLKNLSMVKSFSIAQLDDLISGVITQAVIKRKAAYDWAISYTYSADILWGIVYVVTFCIIVYVLHHSFLQHPKLTLLSCSVVASVFWHWMHLYQQKKAYKYAELSSTKIPIQCHKHEFGLLEHIHEYIKSYFTSNECAKYYEALLVDPFWEVSFTVAASEAITAMLFQPLSASSRAINSAIKQLFDGLSLFMVIFLVIVIFLLILTMCNYRIKLPFFMGTLEPAFPAIGSRVEDIQPSKTLSLLKDKVCRAASSIQDTHIKSILKQDFDECADTSDAQKYCSISKSIQLPNDIDVTPRLNTNSSSSVCLETTNTDVNLRRNKSSPSSVGLKSIDANSRLNRNSSNSIHLESGESCKTSIQACNNDGTDSYSENSSKNINPISPGNCCSDNFSSSDILQKMHSGCKVCGGNANATMDNVNSVRI